MVGFRSKGIREKSKMLLRQHVNNRDELVDDFSQVVYQLSNPDPLSEIDFYRSRYFPEYKSYGEYVADKAESMEIFMDFAQKLVDALSDMVVFSLEAVDLCEFAYVVPCLFE
jgi:hypothetical protein